MARHICQGLFRDQNGKIVLSGTVSVFLAGTSTPASIYAASSGGASIASVTSSASTGRWVFYVDDTEYLAEQLFDLILSKTGYESQTYPNVAVIQPFREPGTHVADYGALGDATTDDAAAINLALAVGGRVIFQPNKTYRVLGANLLVNKDNTEIFLPLNSAIHFDTTRLTAFNVNNLSISGGGKLYSTDMNSTDTIPGTPALDALGIITFGSTTATPVTGFSLDGMEIYMDWVGTQTYPTYGTAKTGSINPGTHRLWLGVVVYNCHDVRIDNNYFHHMLSEAVMNNQGNAVVALPQPMYGHRYTNNYFYLCNTDAISARRRRCLRQQRHGRMRSWT
jgi:hypothetical protein